MFSRLWGSEKRVEEALAQTTTSVNLSPDTPQLTNAPANSNDALAPVIAKSRLWIEDWSEKDEARLRDPDITFGLSWS